MKRSLLLLLLLNIGAVLLAAWPPRATLLSSPSIPAPTLPDWTLADVRTLDPADAAEPTWDLLAVYVRSGGQELDLRLDFADNAPLPDYDLLIALDTAPGGARRLPIQAATDLRWETLLVIPARGAIQALDPRLEPQRGVGLRVLRNPSLDQVSIRVSGLHTVGAQPRAQGFVLAGGWGAVADRSAPSSSGAETLRPAQAAMVFTNSFPAYSPAAALRRWRGAHSGPLGGSHGLALLLWAAQEAEIPVALADLRRPEALAALDSVSGVALVQELAQQELLVLPASPDRIDPAWQSAVAARFGLLEENRPIAFMEPASLANARRAGEVQSGVDGPSAALNALLAEAALAENTPGGGGVLALGGALPASDWGAANHARATFHYLQTRPWIRFLSAGELRALTRARPDLLRPPSAPGAPGGSSGTPSMAPDDLDAALPAAPHNLVGEAAGQAYAALTAPVYPQDERLPALRAGYRGVVWSLVYAAHWVRRPATHFDCLSDPDHDGQAECILAGERWYAQFEIETATLTHLFSLKDGAAHQWVAPSAQMITATSDAAGWDMQRGLLADPAVIPGAFFDDDGPYQFRLDGERLVFRSEDGLLEKEFQLEPDGLRVEYRSPAGFGLSPVTMALAPDPWLRFAPGWVERYTWEQSQDRRSVQIGAGAANIQVLAGCPLTVEAFTDSKAWMDRAENPDREIPPGHFLPFPMLRLKCIPGTQAALSITIRTP